VTFGPSAVLLGAEAAGLAASAGALARGRRPTLPALAGAAIAAAHRLVARQWMARWGASEADLRRPLPGDELVPDPASESTRAVTIDAPPEAVWPWVAQLGQDRGGFYSYRWLENLAGCRMPDAHEIHPEWQGRVVGETVLLHPLKGLPVAAFEPGHALVLEGWGAFVVQPAPEPGGGTRLLARGRVPHGLGAWIGALLVDVPHFVMERRMLLGIKARAEAAARSPAAFRVDGAGPAG